MNIEAALQGFLESKKKALRRSGGSFVTDCISPSCGKEGHLYVRRSTGRSICFKCGERWDLRGLVSEVEGCRRDEAWSVLFGGGAGGDTEAQEGNPFEEDPFERASSPDKPIHFLGPDFVPVERSVEGMEYLESRGLTDPQAIVDFDLRWHGGMRAVVFPIRRNGVLYGWQARRVRPEEGQIRLVSAAGMNKSHHLLNYDMASLMDNVFIVEGPFDCVKPVLAGFGGVATLGKQVSLDQVKMVMDSRCERVYNGLDPDAFREVYDLNSRMGLGKRLFRVRPPEHREDFGACSPEEIREAVESAQEVSSPSDLLEVFLGE